MIHFWRVLLCTRAHENTFVFTRLEEWRVFHSIMKYHRELLADFLALGWFNWRGVGFLEINELDEETELKCLWICSLFHTTRVWKRVNSSFEEFS